MNNPLQLQMLPGGKLSASDWHHTLQDLENTQQWHIKFLETMVPKVHKNSPCQRNPDEKHPICMTALAGTEDKAKNQLPPTSINKNQSTSEKHPDDPTTQQKQTTAKASKVPLSKGSKGNRNQRNCPGKTKTRKTPVEFSRIT
jgi:hypothetical protein